MSGNCLKKIKSRGIMRKKRKEFYNTMAKRSNSEVFSSLLYIIIGVVLAVFKSQTLGWAMTIAGVIFVISGILDVLKKNWAGGAVSLIIGVAILVLGWTATQIVLLVLGVLIAVKGLVAFFGAFKGRKNVFKFIFPILTVVIGLMLAFGNGLDIVILVAGVLLIVDGVLGLIGSLKK